MVASSSGQSIVRVKFFSGTMICTFFLMKQSEQLQSQAVIVPLAYLKRPLTAPQWHRTGYSTISDMLVDVSYGDYRLFLVELND